MNGMKEEGNGRKKRIEESKTMRERSEEVISGLKEVALFKQLRFEWECQIRQLKHLITQLEAENVELTRQLHRWEENEDKYKLDSKRLDKLERELLKGCVSFVSAATELSGDTYKYIEIQTDKEDDIEESTLREAIDELEEQDHE